MITILDVANWFLSKESMDHKKLQKLCYYAQAWSLVLHDNKPVFGGDFEAWAHGPVNRDLWLKFKEFGYSPIPNDTLASTAAELSEKDKILLENVWETYGELTGFQLEALTHEEEPWIEARGGIPMYAPCQKAIRKDTMRSFYALKYSGDGIGE